MTENSNKKTSKQSQATVILTIGLLVVFAFIFLIVFVISNTSTGNVSVAITEDTYREEVAVALENADPSIGEALIEEHTCNVCNVLGNGTVAPLFVGIANRADEIRLPLGAEQYLYESIVHPGVFVLDGYTNSMPNNYADLMTEQEVGHIIAYLMTLDEDSESES